MEITKVMVTMTTDEIQTYKELKERATPRPFIREKFDTANKYVDKCPSCGVAIGKGKFCPECGQRIDVDNIAF